METAAEKTRMEVAVRPARKRAVAAYAYGNGQGKKKKNVERRGKKWRGEGEEQKSMCALPRPILTSVADQQSLNRRRT